jgi:hypothetical protein
MKEVPKHQFVGTIASDYGLDVNKKIIKYFHEFPIVNGKRKISSFYDAIIVDSIGKESPYMLNKTTRNEKQLTSFDHIYFIRAKSIMEIIKEANVQLETESYKLCEGGGWYSIATRYFYKNIYF